MGKEHSIDEKAPRLTDKEYMDRITLLNRWLKLEEAQDNFVQNLKRVAEEINRKQI